MGFPPPFDTTGALQGWKRSNFEHRSAAGHDFLAIVGARLFRLEQVSGSKNPKTARNLVQAISRCREPAQPARINPFLDGDTGFRLEPEIS
jgi:hypothetical protein